MRRLRQLARLCRALGLSGSLLLLLPTTGCAGSIQGQVLDAQTGQAIPGAVVLGVWTRIAGLPGMHHTELVGVREVETDSEGRFALERPSSRYNREDGESVTVYKFGYIAWNNIFRWPYSERREDFQVPGQIRLEVFAQGGDHRKHLDFISAATWSSISHRGDKFDEALERERRMR